MLDADQIESFREDDEALTRAEDRLRRGTVRHRHMMPEDELAVIRAGIFWRFWAHQLAGEVHALREAERQRGEEAMAATPDPARQQTGG